MSHYEYKVIPAPKKGLRAKGIKGTELRFANALQGVMNEQGALGWEYQRTDTLPCDERQGLTGKTTGFQNMLIFRRTLHTVDDSALFVAGTTIGSVTVRAGQPPKAAPEVATQDAVTADSQEYENSRSENAVLNHGREPLRSLGGVTKETSI